jgi:hypothetical protein
VEPSCLIRPILEEGLAECLGRRVRIATLASAPLEAQSTYPIDRLRVTLESGEEIPVIFKQLGPTPVGKEAKGSLREVLIYRRLLPGRRFGAPLLYASVYDEPAARYWLFLEDVGDWTLNGGSMEDWQAAVQWLAEIHGTYLGREDELRALGCLAEHGPDYYYQLAAEARRNLGLVGHRQAVDRFDDLMEDYDALVADFVRRPRGLVHGDIFPSNLVLQDDQRIRPLDWEDAAIGLPACDLARLLDGWGSDKPGFVAAYLDAVGRYTTTPVDRCDFARVMTQCEIINVLWHLGWDVETCRDASFVSGSLRRLKAIGQRLKKSS